MVIIKINASIKSIFNKVMEKDIMGKKEKSIDDLIQEGIQQGKINAEKESYVKIKMLHITQHDINNGRIAEVMKKTDKLFFP